MYKCVCNRSREQDGTRTRLANFSFHFLKKFSLIHRTMELKLCSGQFLVTLVVIIDDDPVLLSSGRQRSDIVGEHGKN